MADHDEMRVNDRRVIEGQHERIDPSAGGSQEFVLFESSVFVRRLLRLSSRCEIVADSLPEDGMEIRFLRWTTDEPDASASFSFALDSSGFVSDSRMGSLLTGGPDGEMPVLWLPRTFVVGRMDQHRRLTTVDAGVVESWWELDEVPRFHLRVASAESVTVYVPMVVFDEGAPVGRSDVFELGGIERQRFRKSDWFDAASPADLWKYLVDAAVFDPRDGGRGRVRCQQCAFAWWSYLMVLYRHTEKAHYRSLARAVAWSVRVDIADDGSWRHGFWNEEPEVHARMLWDGVRLLLSEHELAPHEELLGATEAAAAFAVDNLTEELEGRRLWFLHDSDEGSAPLRVSAPVLGRSGDNSLCLNTHVQALCVLAQMHRVTGSDLFRDEYRRGLEALKEVLRLDCGRGPMVVIDRVLPTLLSSKVPHGFVERVLRFVVFRALVGGYWWARRRAPCLVFSSGYIDRDLGRTMLADEYHVVNLKDLCELQRLDRQPWLEEVIPAAVRFAASLDFDRAVERNPIWAEWIDVLALIDVGDEVASAAAEAKVVDVLGGRSLDALCVTAGVWRFEDGAE